MELNGRYLTAKDTYHKIGSESSLSDILEENVDEKYYLSEATTKKILKDVLTRQESTILHGAMKLEEMD